MTLELISLISLLLGLSFLIYFSFRGVHILILSPLAGLIVAVLSKIDIIEALTVHYMKGFSNYVTNFFMIIFLASIFAKYMDDSGAVKSIANSILKLVGKKSQFRILFAIFFILAALTYGGINLFAVIFLAIALAIPLFKELNIPWHMFIGVWGFGIGTITVGMLPGTPQIQNIIPTEYLGTDLMAAPILGIIAAIVTCIFNFWYLRRELRLAKKRGEGFNMPNILLGGNKDNNDKQDTRSDMSIWRAITPPIVLLILLNILNIDIIYSLLAVIILCIFIFYGRIGNHISVVNNGALNAITPVVNVSAVVGFGTIVAATSGFAYVTKILLDIPGHPAVAVAIGTSIVAGITGSASGGLGIAMEVLSEKFLATGINPELFHRIAGIASIAFDSLPFSGGIVMTLSICGLTHKEGYKHFFYCNLVSPAIALVVAVILGMFMY